MADVTLAIPVEHLSAVRFWARRELCLAAESVLASAEAFGTNTERGDRDGSWRELGSFEQAYAQAKCIVAQVECIEERALSENPDEVAVEGEPGALAEILKVVISSTGSEINEATTDEGDRAAYCEKLRRLGDRLRWATESLTRLEERMQPAEREAVPA
jgi:hypothetical protein